MESSTESLVDAGWQVNSYPDSEKLCVLHKNNKNQFEEKIYAGKCERDFYKNNMKLKIFAEGGTQSTDGMVKIAVAIHDSRHTQNTRLYY